MGNFLTRLRQVAVELEATPGTAETLVAADVVPRTRDIKHSITGLLQERPGARNTLTRLPELVPGQTEVQVTFSVELTGHPDAPSTYTIPPWSDALEACAYQQVLTGRLVVGAITGTFRTGETVTQATSGATGIVVGDARGADGQIFLKTVTGTFDNTNLVTGGDSAATCTPSATLSTNTLPSWEPVSDASNYETVTIGLYLNGRILIVKGAMGTVEWSFTHGNVVLMNFTMMGVYHSYADGSNFATEPQAKVPPAFIGATLNIQDGTNLISDACLNQMTMEIGNTVVLRECSTDADGLDVATITDRAPTASLNPDEVASSDYDFIDSHVQGTEQFVTAEIGSSAGNIFDFITAGGTFQPPSDDDRDGVYGLGLTLSLHGGTYSDGVVGEDNDLILIWR